MRAANQKCPSDIVQDWAITGFTKQCQCAEQVYFATLVVEGSLESQSALFVAQVGLVRAYV